MNILSMMFGGCYNNYGCCDNTSNIYSRLAFNAMMQAKFSVGGLWGGVPGFGGGFSPVLYAGHVGGGEPKAPVVTKEQVQAAHKEFEEALALLNKVTAYKDDKMTKQTDLEAAKTKAQTNLAKNQADIIKLNNELTPLLEQLTAKQQQVDNNRDKKADLNNVHNEIQALQDKIRAKKAEIEAEEAKTEEFQKAYDEADLNLAAYICAKKADAEKMEQLTAAKDAAFENYTRLNNEYSAALAQEAAANAKRQDRAHDKESSGRWWDRTLINPNNWRNKYKGNHDAHIAKCLRTLKNKGRAEALKYAQEKGLITINGNTATTMHDELKKLCDLYTGGFTQRYGEDS